MMLMAHTHTHRQAIRLKDLMGRVKESTARLKIVEDQQESQLREIRRQMEVRSSAETTTVVCMYASMAVISSTEEAIVSEVQQCCMHVQFLSP